MTRNGSTEEQILYLLNGLGNKISPKFERCTGISSSRLDILHELCRTDEINQTTLQKRVDIDGAAITRHLKQLEESGMVARRRNPEDNRVTFVRLTDEGHRRIGEFQLEKEHFIRQLLGGFEQEEVDLLADFLKRMQNNI